MQINNTGMLLCVFIFFYFKLGKVFEHGVNYM